MREAQMPRDRIFRCGRNSRHSANLDEVLVRQWPTGKLRKPASDLKRSEVNPGKTKPFDERCYLRLCRYIIAGIEQYAPSAVGMWISSQQLCAQVIEGLHHASSGHEIGKYLARYRAAALCRLEQ